MSYVTIIFAILNTYYNIINGLLNFYTDANIQSNEYVVVIVILFIGCNH